MTPEEFATAWVVSDDRLNRFTQESLAGIHVAPGDLEFLTHAGLPDSAAPFMGFDAPRQIPTLANQWQLGEEFARYRVIGANGSGDPICIDELANGAIVELNHDADFLVTLINSSAARLAETLLAFRRLVEEALRVNGEDAFLDNDVPAAAIAAFETALKRIDPSAAKFNTFWSHQIEQLRDGPDE
jgi:SUKH-4 immunity protein